MKYRHFTEQRSLSHLLAAVRFQHCFEIGFDAVVTAGLRFHMVGRRHRSVQVLTSCRELALLSARVGRRHLPCYAKFLRLAGLIIVGGVANRRVVGIYQRFGAQARNGDLQHQTHLCPASGALATFPGREISPPFARRSGISPQRDLCFSNRSPSADRSCTRRHT